MSRFLQRFTLNSISRCLFFLVLMPSPLLSMRVTFSNSASAILRRGNGGAAVVLSKHQHFIDIIVLVMALWRRIDFMAKAELFEKPIARWYFEGSHTIEVERGKNAIKAINEAVKRLTQGLIVLLFAEGTRRPGNGIKDIEKGCLAIARRTKRDNPDLDIPIIPIGIHYGRRDWFFVPIWTVDIVIGPLILLSECGDDDDAALWHLLSAMRRAQDDAVRQARNRGARSVYNTKAAND